MDEVFLATYCYIHLEVSVFARFWSPPSLEQNVWLLSCSMLLCVQQLLYLPVLLKNTNSMGVLGNNASRPNQLLLMTTLKSYMS